MLEFRDLVNRKLEGAGAHPSNYISEGVPVGGMQAPFGVPVVFGPDQTTIGAHIRIATVITPDMDNIGQSKPGDTTFFKKVTFEEAGEVFKNRQELLKEDNYMD